LFHTDNSRQYYRCVSCELVFVPSEFHLSHAEEKARYDCHENDPQDIRYRQFVGRLFEAMQPHLCPASTGLDFGSGPGPALAEIFREAGYTMLLFDPYYAPDPQALSRSYDFIVSTETVEHLSRPGEELDRLWNCLKPGGHMGIMTKRISDPANFPEWHYIRDETHISFFADKTFQYLAQIWKAELTILSQDMILLKKR
jgi:SAM-dependent methyltransferase